MSRDSNTDRVGLCVSCEHARSIRSARGSTFWLCEASKSDPRLRKYPQLPVRQCVGYRGNAEAAHD
ncbi:MAG: hypothetical protein KC766_32495 [Myxococcales bacterium]|nr:hypothetical protein [Myxococcales bacterium]